MKRYLTLAQYRNLDLTLFALMLCGSEFIISTAATRWFPGQPFTVSITAALCAIVLMRWGGWAAIHAAAGAVVYCFVTGATPRQLLIYTLGNLACLLSLLLLKAIGGERIRKDLALSLLFAEATLLFMQLGRAAVAVLLGAEPLGCIGFFTTDALSGVFAMAIVYIVRQLDGVFENQKIYLIRVQKQK